MSEKKKIGIMVIATGKYDQFIPPLYKSVQKYFMKNHEVKMFVFTDSDNIPVNDMIVKIQHEHKPWPGPTLARYETFFKHKDILSQMDYLFYCDADMRFVAEVGDEILPEPDSNGLVGTEHPGFFGGRRGTYETRPESTSYVAPEEGKIYYAGGFNGGTSEAFLKMSEVLSDNINKDLDKGITPIWHDESAVNRYFIDNPPKTLNPSYCYPENWNIPFEKKLLALDKNHKEIRNV
jgi:histo-blood group ABO system transferase